MKEIKIVPVCFLALIILTGLSASAGAQSFGRSVQRVCTEDFFIEECTFSSEGSNTYFVLIPGHQLTLEGLDGKEEVQLVITVLGDTEEVYGITTRVVEEFESRDGEVAEISRNFLAICNETGNVFYFGEEVDIYEGA